MSQDSSGQLDREQRTPFLRIRNAPAIRWIGIGITVAAVIFYILYIRRNIESIPPLSWTWATVQTLGVSLGLQCIAILGGAIAWIVLLRGSGGFAPAGHGLSIYLISQFGKYIPGNVGQHVGRVTLAQSESVRATPVLISMSVEVVVSILASLLVVLVSLTASNEPLHLASQLVPTPRIIGVVAFIIASGIAVGWWIIRYKPGPFRTLLSKDDGRFPGFLILTGALALHTLAILVIGAILILLGSGLYGIAAPYIQVCGVYALAWVLGYLTPGAPAGLGIREVILVAGLSPFYGPSAAAIALIHRLIVTGADALMLGVGFILRRTSSVRMPADMR